MESTMFTEIMLEFVKLNARLDKIQEALEYEETVVDVSISPIASNINLEEFSESLNKSFITIADSQSGIRFNNGQDTCN